MIEYLDDDGEADNDYSVYKQNEKAKGRTPKDWGDWLDAGMPVPIFEGEE